MISTDPVRLTFHAVISTPSAMVVNGTARCSFDHGVEGGELSVVTVCIDGGLFASSWGWVS
jgi:hypothetical protein